MSGLWSVIAVTGILAMAGCSASGSGDAPSGSPNATPTPTIAERAGELELADGTVISYRCMGEGSPAVILEAGTDSAGTQSFPQSFVGPIAATTTVCTYDRPGTGPASSAPPDRARTYDDLVGVLDSVLTGLELEPPYVVAGQSGGGNIAIEYAAAHPDRVAGLVTIDSYHDDPAEMAAWQAQDGFTWEDNPEHVDWVQASAVQDAHSLPIGDFPVRIISATQADEGGPENQAYWLGLSPRSSQVLIEGPHDLHEAAPERVATEFTTFLEELGTG